MKTIRYMFFLVIITFAGISSATLMNIIVDQDANLASIRPNTPGGGASLIYIGDEPYQRGWQDFQGMFGFDMSPLTSLLHKGDSLVINDIKFNAYNTFNYGNGAVVIALGNTDNWDSSVTWKSSNNNFGSDIQSIWLEESDPLGYVSWDLDTYSFSSICSGDEFINEFIDDNYLTFYLHALPMDGYFYWENLHDFEGMTNRGGNKAYLSIDYDIIPKSVSEPSLLSLLFFPCLFAMYRNAKGDKILS